MSQPLPTQILERGLNAFNQLTHLFLAEQAIAGHVPQTHIGPLHHDPRYGFALKQALAKIVYVQKVRMGVVEGLQKSGGQYLCLACRAAAEHADHGRASAVDRLKIGLASRYCEQGAETVFRANLYALGRSRGSSCHHTYSMKQDCENVT